MLLGKTLNNLANCQLRRLISSEKSKLITNIQHVVRQNDFGGLSGSFGSIKPKYVANGLAGPGRTAPRELNFKW